MQPALHRGVNVDRVPYGEVYAETEKECRPNEAWYKMNFRCTMPTYNGNRMVGRNLALQQNVDAGARYMKRGDETSTEAVSQVRWLQPTYEDKQSAGEATGMRAGETVCGVPSVWRILKHECALNVHYGSPQVCRNRDERRAIEFHENATKSAPVWCNRVSTGWRMDSTGFRSRNPSTAPTTARSAKCSTSNGAQQPYCSISETNRKGTHAKRTGTTDRPSQ